MSHQNYTDAREQPSTDFDAANGFSENKERKHLPTRANASRQHAGGQRATWGKWEQMTEGRCDRIRVRIARRGRVVLTVVNNGAVNTITVASPRGRHSVPPIQHGRVAPRGSCVKTNQFINMPQIPNKALSDNNHLYTANSQLTRTDWSTKELTVQ